ncbi:MAG: hypothetical protein E6G32_14005 [Actinobacteria bacterium]|nr:MAG: hypothetical protein E6G32_14005 [Actinomycetota bacterium]
MGRRRVDSPRGSTIRGRRSPRAGAPHGGDELLHAIPVGGDRARDRGLPRQGKRLERHRLQLSRRQVRAGVRRPVRRRRQERDRRTCRGVQHGFIRRRRARDVQRVRTSRGRADGARELARVAPGRRPCSGHRDTGFTDCPGNALYARLGAIASQAAELGLPKLYAPSVTGQPGGPVEFQAQLTAELPWTVTVTDSLGLTVATGSGTGASVDWTWDASAAAPGRYSWTISAGEDVRPATGFVGAAPVALALKSPSAKPGTISPNGDGVDERTTVTYTLSAAATVTATLRDADGRQLATLFSAPQTAGKHSFSFAADGIPDGVYTIFLTATEGTKTVTASVPVTVDRTFSRLTASSRAFSPNGDGRLDSISFSFVLARAAHVRVDVEQSGRLIAPISVADDLAGDQSVTWDGMTQQGRARDGTYAGVVTVTTELGTAPHSVLFRVDTVPPTLRAISFRRRMFRLSEAAVVSLSTGGRVYTRSFKAGAFTFPLSRAVTAYRITAQDAAGNLSRTLRSR